MQLIWIASLFFAVLIAIFAVQNTALVTVWLLAWRIESVAVSTLVLAAAALGALTTYLFGLARGIRARVALRGNRSTIRDQDTLIADLRTRLRELERENDAYRRGMGVASWGSGSAGVDAAAIPIEPAAVLDSPRTRPAQPRELPRPQAPPASH